MSAPTDDRAAILAVVRELKGSDHELRYVLDGGEEPVRVTTVTEAVDAITAVDMAHLHVTLPDRKTNGWVLFVLGNDPEEVVCNYTINLDPTVSRLLRRWEA